MTFLVHFYYGDRLEVFQTGVGMIIRALGHSKKIKIYIINDSFSWVDDFNSKSKIPHQIISRDEAQHLLDKLKEELALLENNVCLFANFDLLFENLLEIEDFVLLVKEVNKKNEVIITCEKKYDFLENLGDYVSSFELQEF